ncbi:hypothetical protein ACROYT_G019901 [Oculina patagonica]
MDGRKEIVVPSPIPSKLHELIYAFRESKALFAACDLGIFDLLHESDAPQSAKDISSKMSTNVDATTRLMDTLVALELLEKTKQGESWLYSNTKMAKQFLTKSSPDSVDGYIRHSNKLLYHLFGNLESAVREGSNQWMKTFGQSPEDAWKAAYNTEEDRLRFLRAMHSTSRHSCHAVVTAFDLSEFQSCCDLGGGTGTMAYTLCQYYPTMKITVCELQSAVDLAHHFRPSSEDCPNQGNVSYVVGNFFHSDLPKADLYVLSRILHDWPEEKVDFILSNVFKSLPSGGSLLLADKFISEDKTGPKSTLLQSLNMLVQTHGKERTATEYRQLLEKQGFVDIQTKQLESSLDAILCRKA